MSEREDRLVRGTEAWVRARQAVVARVNIRAQVALELEVERELPVVEGDTLF